MPYVQGPLYEKKTPAMPPEPLEVPTQSRRFSDPDIGKLEYLMDSDQ